MLGTMPHMRIRGSRQGRITGDEGGAERAAEVAGDAPASAGEGELMTAITAGDLAAFETLYGRYATLVYSTSLQVLGDVHAAEDVTQEIFLRIWRRPETYDPGRGRFVSWLLSVTRNRAIDELRTRSRRRRFETDPPEAAESSPDPDAQLDPAAAALVTESRDALVEAMRGLPPEQREAIEMAYFKGMTQTEIADQLRQPLGTVKTRVRLGMQKMRSALLAAGWTGPR